MRKRNRILVLPVVMLAAVIVLWILHGPAGPDRDIAAETQRKDG